MGSNKLNNPNKQSISKKGSAPSNEIKREKNLTIRLTHGPTGILPSEIKLQEKKG